MSSTNRKRKADATGMDTGVGTVGASQRLAYHSDRHLVTPTADKWFASLEPPMKSYDTRQFGQCMSLLPTSQIPTPPSKLRNSGKVQLMHTPAKSDLGDKTGVMPEYASGTAEFVMRQYAYTNDRPPFSYAGMVAQAIILSQDCKLTLKDIYAWINTTYPHYQFNEGNWQVSIVHCLKQLSAKFTAKCVQNSVRHNLSLNPSFIRVPKESGKGAFWTLSEDKIDVWLHKNVVSSRMVQDFLQRVKERPVLIFHPVTKHCPAVTLADQDTYDVLEDLQKIESIEQQYYHHHENASPIINQPQFGSINNVVFQNDLDDFLNDFNATDMLKGFQFVQSSPKLGDTSFNSLLDFDSFINDESNFDMQNIQQ
ncbi:hypothetical protein MIR68_001463 [Amoeboaphelidium protococcarum]|nr:hypothetical protein MIR68_001463 [Amoeboaphelidium protococcarum]